MGKADNKKGDRTELINNLWSSDLSKSKAAVSRIRKDGELEDIPEIIRALRSHEKEEIKSELKNLLCDINVSGIQPYIIEAVKDTENKEILPELLSVCWENKQDFSKFLDVFSEAFVNSEYRASLEAFTMIEKIFMDYEVSPAKLETTIKYIKTSYPDLPENKRELCLVLLDTLEGQRS